MIILRACLAGNIDSGFFGKTESVELFVIVVHAKFLAERDKERIAGVFKALCKSLRAVAGMIVAVHDVFIHFD